MVLIGLDLGSTTLSLAAVDAADGRTVQVMNEPNKRALPSDISGGVLLDAEGMALDALSLIECAERTFPEIAAIGLTGQMHGVLYLSGEGQALSPLYSWQDQRGQMPVGDGVTLAQALSERSGYPLATGYGLVTHSALQRQGRVPEQATVLCTIADYVGMRLCGLASPCLHESMAHSLGLYDMHRHAFDVEAVERLGINPAILPMTVSDGCVLGYTGRGIPVAVALGDNQAGYIGATADLNRDVLLNIGTSGQLTVHGDLLRPDAKLERRPLMGDAHIAVGASLCGGRAWQEMASFLNDCAQLLGVLPPDDLYERMNRAALGGKPNALRLRASFLGTRQDPTLRGSLQGIGLNSLTCANLLHAAAEGIVNELYEQYAAACIRQGARLIGSGNALRRNPALQAAAQRAFGTQLLLPVHQEEAAYGAALLAGTVGGIFSSIAEAQRLIRYEPAYVD